MYVKKFLMCVAPCVACAFFGWTSASTLEDRTRRSERGLVSDAEASNLLGGAPGKTCSQVGGTNCETSYHVCATTGCQATSVTCALISGTCFMLATATTPSTFPCANYLQYGNCCAKTSSACVQEYSGVPSWMLGYGYYCKQSNCTSSGYCGEGLYSQYPCRT